MTERLRVSSGGPWEDRVGYSRAVRVGDQVWVSGSTGTQPDGSIAESAGAQTRAALDTIELALHKAGASIADVVRVRSYVVDITEWEAIADALRERFGAVRPAMTMVEVARLISPEQRIEIEVDAVIGSAATAPPEG
jgi:enamine deaminase RidA (YjgF/YER057c/UK114 family)